MKIMELLRLLLLRLARYSRKKWLLVTVVAILGLIALFVIFQVLMLIVNQFFNVYAFLDCLSAKMLARHEICLPYEKNLVIGNLCSDWCSSNVASSVVTSCPSKVDHTGKQCVFFGHWKGRSIIVKAKRVKASHLSDDDLKFTREELIQGLEAIVSSSFNGAGFIEASHLIPWEGRPQKLSSLTEKELHSIWLLAQDNEFIYSQVLGRSTKYHKTKIFPQVLGSCGHFYAVEYVEEIIKLSDVVPEEKSLLSFVETFPRRLNITLMLLKFLASLESLDLDLHLCDVKYDQFGIQNGSILLIDSDMLYSSETVRESVHHIDTCKKNEDCDFFDCKGACKASHSGDLCVADLDQDSNLKRVCRNLFFTESPFNLISSNKHKAGLLSHAPTNCQADVDLIEQLCSRWISSSQMIATITKMIDLASAMLARIGAK